MLALGRPGRLRGAGFFDYHEGKRTGLWPGLATEFPVQGDPAAVDLAELGERMLFAEAIESVRCLDEGVLNTVADANIGSIMGIGFPAWTGGVLQYINGYPGGPAGFVARADEFAAAVRRRGSSRRRCCASAPRTATSDSDGRVRWPGCGCSNCRRSDRCRSSACCWPTWAPR